MPQPFEYYKPKTRLEAIELLTRPDLHAAPLIVHPKPTAPRQAGAEALIDLSLLGLDYIRTDSANSVHIGALATLQEMVDDPTLNAGTRLLLSQAARLAAGPGIRNLSGLWGAIQARSGPPEVLLALLALDAQIVLLGAGEKRRTLTFPEFYARNTDLLRKGELLLEAVLPPAKSGGWGLERVARTPRDEAIVAAAAIVEVKDDIASRVTLALAGANPQPMRLAMVENQLKGETFNTQILRGVADAVMAQANPLGDFRGSSEYRRSMTGLVAHRALEKAWKQAVSQESEV
jgi:aerobic carbon-monoxide dehydrogenase medium subunit